MAVAALTTSMVMLWQSRNQAFGNNLVCKCTAAFGYNRNKRLFYLDAFVPYAKKKPWWDNFFLQEEGNWFGWKQDHDDISDVDIQQDDDDDDDDDDEYNNNKKKFEAWKRRAEAITELREAQQDMANQESRRWEDWLLMPFDAGNDNAPPVPPLPPPPPPAAADNNTLIPSSLSNLFRQDDDDDDDLLYEDRVFRYASLNSAAFLALLILVPWALDFLVHDYALMPFLDRYVKTVPLAAQMLDVRRNQKLEIVQQLNLEKARLRLEVEIGKAPPLSDDEIWLELRDKALELREEWRLENRRAFANIWSDVVFGVSLFILLYCNQNKVALLKFTGYKIINNVSDTGKAFLIILVTDIFLGYHSESGWQTLAEIFVEHYGVEVDQAAITIFVCLVPVIIDACVKLWMFKFLPRLSPKVANIFREMKRH